MARTVRSYKLDTRTARLDMPAFTGVYWHALSPGRAIGYARNAKEAGTWRARFIDNGIRREHKIGLADDILDADGVNVFSFAQAQEEARKWFLTVTAEATGEAPRRGKYTVQDAMTDYLAHLQRRGAPTWLNTKYDADAYILPKLGAVKVSKLTRARLEAWRASVAESPVRTRKGTEKNPVLPPQTEEEIRRRRVTANRITRRLQAALNLAVEEGRVYANPLAWKLKPYRNVEVARAAFLSDQEAKELVKACEPEPGFQRLVIAALHLGARYQELARLRVADFDSANKTVFIERSKGGRQRHVHLDPEAVRFFEKLCAGRSPGELMLVRDDGQPWSKGAQKKPMRRAWKRFAANAGEVDARTDKRPEITRCSFHGLRHTTASRWIRLGVPLKLVAEQLGHVDTKMVERHYGHISASHLAETFNNLPGIGLNVVAKPRPSPEAPSAPNVVSFPVRRQRRRKAEPAELHA